MSVAAGAGLDPEDPAGGRGVAAWGSDAWRRYAIDWVDRQLAARGAVRTGPADQPHLRPWATALRVPTSAGVVWLKACARGTAAEVDLYPVLVRHAAEHVLVPLAVDADRGWLLLPDGGPSVGDRYEGVAVVDALAEAMAAYGQLQRSLAAHVDELLTAGVADMRPALLPARFGEALAIVRSQVAERGSTELDEALARVEGLGERVERWCTELAAAPGGASLDHNDLHAWNVLGEAGSPRFYDWGDAVVAHPFACLLEALGSMAELGPVADDRAVRRVRDAYLDAFTDLGRRDELVEVAALAAHSAKIARALTWERAARLAGEDSEEGRRLAEAPLRTLERLVDAPGQA